MSSTDLCFGKLASSQGQWLKGDGPESQIVISTRVRLARNLAGFPFLSKCDDRQRNDVQNLIVAGLNGTNLADKYAYVHLDEASSVERQFLVERQLISRQHSDGKGPRGVAIVPDETAAMMVNEEDHLRMQVLCSGLRLRKAWQKINELDDQLEDRLEFAFHDKYGYLTACPTNVGTGIRVSVMLHLPALKITGEIERVLRAARDMHLAVRGLYGEGTEAIGEFYQVSNQMTLGKTEEEILEEFGGMVVPKITDYEMRARQMLTKEKPVVLEDKIWRAVGALKFARTISSQETLFLLSQLRMGVHLGLISDISLDTINELFLATQPAHMQVAAGRRLDEDERSQLRAEHIRRKLANHLNN